MNWAIGLDLGGTNLKSVAVAEDGKVLRKAMKAACGGDAGAAEWTDAGWTAVSEIERAQGSGAAAVGVCAPGLAAADGRSVARGSSKLPGLTGIDWTEALRRRETVPVLNDGHAALLGETWIGAARGRRHVVMLTLGTGVGGAAMVDGRLLRGAIGRAGHIGLMSLDPDGATTIVGVPGTLEAMCGDCTVAARTGGRFVTTEALVAAHRAGDADATHVWLRSVRALAQAVGSCIHLFDPEMVVLGGGIAQAGAALFEPIAAQLDLLEWRPGGHRVLLAAAAHGEWAGAIGAAWQAIHPDREQARQ